MAARKWKKIPKLFSRNLKVAAVDLYEAQVPLKIREQLKISESSLCYILSFARRNPANPIIARKNRVAHSLKLP
jgi:Holliday junction resolvase